jgi:uncharacterized membrane protein YjjP (DUF1212 family)
VVSLGVDLGKVTALNDLSRRIINGELDRFQARTELEHIDHMPRSYNRWLVVVMVGLACAAFSRLFGGDWIIFGITFGASAVAMFLRQELAHRHFNPLLVVVACAFVAGCLASTAGLFHLSEPARDGVGSGRFAIGPRRAADQRGTRPDSRPHGHRSCPRRHRPAHLPGHCPGPAARPQPDGSDAVNPLLAALLEDAFWSAIAAVGFAILFNVPRRALPGCAVAAALGHALRTWVMQLGLPIEPATLLAATMIGFHGRLPGAPV